jgi:hypothetical protein
LSAELFLRSAKPFAETTLWLFLNCIVDGLSVLAYGQECTYEERNQTARATKKDGWLEIGHYDPHASNCSLSVLDAHVCAYTDADAVFLGEFNTSHASTPVMKVFDPVHCK